MSVQRNKAFLSLFQPGAPHRDAALAYASYQLFVHPLHPGSKQPKLREWQRKATTHSDQIRKWWPEGSKNNIGIYLVPSCVVVIDVDPRNSGDITFEQLCNDHGQLPPTYTVKTAGDGRHYYFRVPADFYDSNTTYPTQLGEGVEFLQNKYVVAPPSELEDGRQYTVSTGDVGEDFAPLPFDWLDDVVRARLLTRKEVWHEVDDWSFEAGQRNDGATKVAGYFRRIGMTADEIEGCLHILGSNGRFENYTEDVKFRQTEIPRIATSIGRNRPAEIRLADIALQVRQKSYKPSFELDNPALQGPIGEFVKQVMPYTEAHPAALLAQALTAFGNMIGGRAQDDPGPGFMHEGKHQKATLFTMIVGQSAQAAKGDSWNRVESFLKTLDPTWRVRTGLQSSEGLINATADDIETGTVLHNLTEGSISKGVKKGTVDKRFMLIEQEFARVFHVAQRQGSTLKDTLRTMYDSGTTETIAKSSVQVATNVTLSIIGHITNTDLSRDMTEYDLTNGFGNRFLYVHSERTKFLPVAQNLPKYKMQELQYPLREALEFAETAPADYEWTPDAFDLWIATAKDMFNRGRKPMPTVEDELAGRARANVRRMAVIFAVADCSDEIQLQHMEAAVAFHQYCLDSMLYIFGNRIGDRMADKLYRGLIEFAPGLTKSEIHRNIFKSNPSMPKINRALEYLLDRGLIHVTKVKRGRKTTDLYQIIQQTYEGEK